MINLGIRLFIACMISTAICQTYGKKYGGNCDSDNDCAGGQICVPPGARMNANANSQHKCVECKCTYSSQCYYDNNQVKCNCSGFGTFGDLCQFEIDECAGDPCLNNGTCVNSVNMYVCVCPCEFSGVNCETALDTCGSTTCLNGGTCHYECLCASGYSGFNCSESSQAVVVCEGFTLTLTCNPGTTLNIINANYGRTAPGSVQCDHPSIQTTSCYAAGSLSTVSGLCSGLQTCNVAVNSGVFGGDPCPGTYKYLEVEYNCVQIGPSHAGLCEILIFR